MKTSMVVPAVAAACAFSFPFSSVIAQPTTTITITTTTTITAIDYCEGNFDYDNDVDGSDASIFKQDFGRSSFKNPCPGYGPAPLSRTGQTAAFATGDDGYYEKGITWPMPRFTDNNNGTVTDNLTGLIWLKNATCYGARIWTESLNTCNGLASGSCGLSDGSLAGDWRLPNRNELNSLIDAAYYNPALSNTAGTGHWSAGDPFTNVQLDTYYWSSTTFSGDTGIAWQVRMNDGYAVYNDKGISRYIWPVRGGRGTSPSCLDQCESELEICLTGCQSWPPEMRYICNDNCTFDYLYNCVPSCE